MTEEVEECSLGDKLAGILRHGGGKQALFQVTRP